jgi:hypothetical protein
MMSAMRLAPHAWPTALAPLRTDRAISPYVRDSASGIAPLKCGAEGTQWHGETERRVIEVPLDFAQCAGRDAIVRRLLLCVIG